MGCVQIPLSDPVAEPRLVRRVLAGERAAFDALYEAYFHRIYAFARRRAADAAQAEAWSGDVWLELLRRLPAHRGEAPLGGWIFAIARQVVARLEQADAPAAAPREGAPRAGWASAFGSARLLPPRQ
jgi:RNA polymerase sigma-70 factor (ECF subfamily)